MSEVFVTKNNGELEAFDPEKIFEHVKFACEGLKNVQISDLIMNANLKIANKMKSSDIQLALVQSANELVSEKHHDYSIVAGRLLNQQIHKECYNQYAPKDFKEEIRRRVSEGVYTKDFDVYTDEDLDFFGSKIKYDDADSLPYIAVNQFYSKYLIKHNGKCAETIQEALMAIPMAIFSIIEDKAERNDLIVRCYNLLNKRKISFPTPIMNGARTNFKKFISCNVIDMGDSVKSLSLAIAKILQCTANKSGLGINASRIRGLGAPIGTPERCKHFGILPLLKTVESATAALSQISRGGSSNVTLPFFHYEVELFSQLGDSKGTIENRTRFIDQTIILNSWFLEKALKKEDIFLFHADKAKKLYEVLGNKEEFDIEYQKLVKTVHKTSKKKVNAFELLNNFIYERAITGRVYFVFADNMYNGPWKDPVYNSNLCCIEENQLVKTKDGEKKIKDISRDDLVLSYNENENKFEYKKVLNVKNMGKKQIVRLKYNDRELLLTPDHKLLTQRGWVEAQDLRSDDRILESPDFFKSEGREIIEINFLKFEIEFLDFENVYDIEVEDNHNFFANGLCVHNCEIQIPNKPLDGSLGEPEIGCCILGNVNLGYAEIDDIPECAEILVKFLDTLIDYSDFGIDEVEYAAQNRRTLGIGLSNLFGALAKNKIFYNTQEGRQYIHEVSECLSYNLLKTSNELAKAKGKCPLFDETKYSDGWLPFDLFPKLPENNFELKQNWASLREDIKKYGLRNSTVMAVPPAGNSANVSNSTNGIEPPREIVSKKTDKSTVIKKLVPFFSNKNYFTTAWGDDFNNID